jgi:hypothetical protein
MRAICTKCGATVYWKAGRGARLKDQRSQCCGAPLKSKAKKKPKVIARPYMRSRVIREYILNYGTDKPALHYSYEKSQNLYLAPDNKSIHLAGVWLHDGWHVPVTLIPTDNVKEAPDGRPDLTDHVGPYRLFVCAGTERASERVVRPAGVFHLCVHCKANADWCRSDKRYWVDEATYQRLLKRGESDA